MITVPAFNFLWSNADSEAGHFRRYTLVDLTKKLESIGFKIEYSTYIFSIFPIPVFLFRTIPSKIRKKSSTKESHIKEHQNKKGLLNKLLNIVFNIELRNIKKGRKIITGGSCLVVAKKNRYHANPN